MCFGSDPSNSFVQCRILSVNTECSSLQEVRAAQLPLWFSTHVGTRLGKEIIYRTEKNFIDFFTLNSKRCTSTANDSLSFHFIASLFCFSKCFPETILIPACETWHKIVSMMYMFIF